MLRAGENVKIRSRRKGEKEGRVPLQEERCCGRHAAFRSKIREGPKRKKSECFEKKEGGKKKNT